MNSPEQWPDEVKRVKDEMDMHAVAGAHGWAVFKLADGTPLDHTPYPGWADAVKAAKWDRDNYVFLEIQPDGMPYREAQAVLEYARVMHQAGYRIPSPDWEAGPMVASMPLRRHDQKRMLSQLKKGKPLYPDDIPYGNLPNLQIRKGNI